MSMANAERKSATHEPAPCGGGLIRTVLAGPGHTLAEAFANLAHAPGLQVTHHPTRRLLGARMPLSAEEGDGYFDLTQIGADVYVIVADVAYKDPRLESLPGDGLIQFYFKLAGDLTLEVSRTEPLRLNRPSLLVYSQPRGVDGQEWIAPSARERSIAITVRPSFLAEYFQTSSAAVPAQLQTLIGGSPGQFQYCQLPLSAQMFETAARLVDNPHSGTLRLLYTEALTLALLCTAMAGFDALADARGHEYSEHDLRCLHAARNLLMKQLAPAPTIRQIARAVGMNETSLKRGFRAVFGETLFAFSVRCRMQHALVLLREQKLAVARVAEAVGYSHQTSFATAFRRHFGVCPKDARPARRCAPAGGASPRSQALEQRARIS
jgi:AraC-like DNA-binding protein